MISYLLYPFGDYDLDNRIFNSPYGILRTILRQRGIDLQTHDRGNLSTAAKVLCFNHRPSVYATCRRAGLPPEQLVLFLTEPRPVMPDQYRRVVWNLYGTVFTFLDDLIDNQRIYKMHYPQGQTLAEILTPFHQRKFLTLINANKYSYVDHELYSFRRQAIHFFEQRKYFDLFGYGWGRNGALALGPAIQAFKNNKIGRYVLDVLQGFYHSSRYGGQIQDKYAVLSQYKFSLAFENEEETLGWISEKLFDCLFAGTVPIYLGAKNISNVVPPNCFIDMRSFSNFSELEKHLRSMTEYEFSKYQEAGQRFLRSPGFTLWKPENVFSEIAVHL